MRDTENKNELINDAAVDDNKVNETKSPEAEVTDAKAVKAAEVKKKATGNGKQELPPKKQSKFAKKMKKILVGIIVFLIVFYTGVLCYFKLPVKAYLDASERTFTIPDSNKGFIAQGLCYDGSSGDFYVTGYMKDGSASPIYIVDRENGKLERKVLMSNPNGSDFTGHSGGISYYNGMVYVCGGESNCLYVFNPADIREASNGDKVSYVDVVDLSNNGDEIRCAFSTVADGMIFVGEFYRDPNYMTNSLHTIETLDGSQKALMVGFSLDGNVATPQVAYSLPDQIQGACFTDESIFLSSSYGPAFSKIYDYPKNGLVKAGTQNVLGTNVPLYILDSQSPENLYKISPMSEEIEVVGGKLYTMCESASNKYIFGKLLGAWKVYATDMSELYLNY